jgi:CheY-like chemotaxis protein
MSQAAKAPLLIVEDDERMRVLAEVAARRAGVFSSITLVADGQVALDWLRERQAGDLPGLIVSDLSMPRLDGLELIRAVKGNPATRQIPVAIITSSDQPNDRAVALAAGACRFEAKPLGLDALAELLRTLHQTCGEPPAR